MPDTVLSAREDGQGPCSQEAHILIVGTQTSQVNKLDTLDHTGEWCHIGDRSG